MTAVLQPHKKKTTRRRGARAQEVKSTALHRSRVHRSRLNNQLTAYRLGTQESANLLPHAQQRHVCV